MCKLAVTVKELQQRLATRAWRWEGKGDFELRPFDWGPIWTRVRVDRSKDKREWP